MLRDVPIGGDRMTLESAIAGSGLARSARILAFLFRWRHAGVFSGMDLETLAMPDEPVAEAGSPEEFAADLAALGPTFVKIGQVLSTRADMVPPEWLAALEPMQDAVAPLPFADIRAVVEAELGVRIGKAFAEFDEVPAGCASLAQVHRAVLRDGHEVAVKVQRPGVLEQVSADLDALSGIAARVDAGTDIGRRMRFSDWVHELRRTLFAELDFCSEAGNLERFGQYLAGYPELTVPQPAWSLTTRRVLTMDFIHGSKVTALAGVRRTEEDFGRLARALLRAYLDQAFVHGQMHADPHPGNLLVTPDGRLAIFDLGMVAYIPPARRDQLLKLMLAAVDGRGEDVVHETLAMGTRLEDFDAGRYNREVSQRVARYAARSAHPGTRGPGEGRLVLDLVRIGTVCHLRSPPELNLLGKTLLNLEDVCNALEPGLDARRVVESHLQSVMRKRIARAFSPAGLAGDLIELQTLAREAPRRIGDLLALLSENRLQVRLTGLQESHLMENLQKIANRIATGLIVAALLVASALLMRVDTGAQLFGYPALAMVLFLVAAALGLGIVISALLSDRRARPHEERGPR